MDEKTLIGSENQADPRPEPTPALHRIYEAKSDSGVKCAALIALFALATCASNKPYIRGLQDKCGAGERDACQKIRDDCLAFVANEKPCLALGGNECRERGIGSACYALTTPEELRWDVDDKLCRITFLSA